MADPNAGRKPPFEDDEYEDDAPVIAVRLDIDFTNINL
jgi:hypothetical protein